MSRSLLRFTPPLRAPLPQAAVPAAACLVGKAAFITGGQTRLGQAAALAFARGGADVAVLFPSAAEARGEAGRALVLEAAVLGRRCLCLGADVALPAACEAAVAEAHATFGRLDVVVAHPAAPVSTSRPVPVSEAVCESTFVAHVSRYYGVIKAALPHLPEAGIVINVVPGERRWSTPRGAGGAGRSASVLTLTHALDQALREDGIRVRALSLPPFRASSLSGGDGAGSGGEAVEQAAARLLAMACGEKGPAPAARAF